MIYASNQFQKFKVKCMRGKLQIKKVVAFICLNLSLVLISLSGYAQSKLVTGKITGSDNGLPLPGVTVKIKGSTQATGSKPDGTYSITAGSNKWQICY
jgi:hypothetical protein